MSDENLKTFPANRGEALAMLYVEKHASEETTPEELVEMYLYALKKIRDTLSKWKPDLF